MPQIINTNIASLNAQRNLNRTQGALEISLQRLSSGLRINSAKDDAAGLAISDRFTTQIRGLNQAIRNANDGISFSQVAEGALSTVGDAMQRIRELAVQAINDTNSPQDRVALNNEVQQLIAEVNRVADSTEFNGQNILDGSLGDLTFQVGANQNQTIQVTGVDARGSRLGADFEDGITVLESAVTGLSDLSVNGTSVAVTGLTSVESVINAINDVVSETGVTAVKQASVTTAALTYSDDGVAGDGSFSINGVTISVDADVDDRDTIVSQINSQQAATGGVVATADGTDDIILSNSNGADIEVIDAGTNGPFLGGNETYSAGIRLLTDVGGAISVTGADVGALGLSAPVSGSSVFADIDVLNGSNANDALLTIDFALQQVSNLRAELGAVQIRFEATIANLEVQSENMSAARSRILDADFAAETAALTRATILQQAGISVLAQANALPQQVLALLQ